MHRSLKIGTAGQSLLYHMVLLYLAVSVPFFQ